MVRINGCILQNNFPFHEERGVPDAGASMHLIFFFARYIFIKYHPGITTICSQGQMNNAGTINPFWMILSGAVFLCKS